MYYPLAIGLRITLTTFLGLLFQYLYNTIHKTRLDMYKMEDMTGYRMRVDNLQVTAKARPFILKRLTYSCTAFSFTIRQSVFGWRKLMQNPQTWCDILIKSLPP